MEGLKEVPWMLKRKARKRQKRCYRKGRVKDRLRAQKEETSKKWEKEVMQDEPREDEHLCRYHRNPKC